MTSHLTHEQLCDMILARSPHPLSSDFAALQCHLHTCPACTEELASLRSSLALLREASTGYSRRQLARSHEGAPIKSIRSTNLRPLLWTAAALIAIATTLPFSLHNYRQPAATPSSAIATTPVQTQQSDEALLEEINQELSAPIPSPVRPLADPTASSATTPYTSSRRN